MRVVHVSLSVEHPHVAECCWNDWIERSVGRRHEEVAAGFTPLFQVASGPERPFDSIPGKDGFTQNLNIYGVRA